MHDFLFDSSIFVRLTNVSNMFIQAISNHDAEFRPIDSAVRDQHKDIWMSHLISGVIHISCLLEDGTQECFPSRRASF